MDHVRGAPANPRQDRAVASNFEEPHSVGELFLSSGPSNPDRSLRPVLQSPALSQEQTEPNIRRRLLWTRLSHSKPTRKNKTKDYANAALAKQQSRRLI